LIRLALFLKETFEFEKHFLKYKKRCVMVQVLGEALRNARQRTKVHAKDLVDLLILLFHYVT